MMVAIVDIKGSLVTIEKDDGTTPFNFVESIEADMLHTHTEATEDIGQPTLGPGQTILHIYHEHGCAHKLVRPNLSSSQERRWGPTPKEKKECRIAKKEAKKIRAVSQVIPSESPIESALACQSSPLSAPELTAQDKESFFLHTPYLSFHLPPLVLYTGSSRYIPCKPIALIHTGWFWKSYKIQLGPSLSLPGVIDPRGVVSWRHNGGSKAELRSNEADGNAELLKGYRVRGWRLWGETGKSYVHQIRNLRKKGAVFDDPDVNGIAEDGELREKARADEIVFLKWVSPLSRHTRAYSFRFRGIEFQWKGTGTVNEKRKCGWMLRFCHLKLVAKIPVSEGSTREVQSAEVCLGKYVSSIAAEKSGILEIFDGAMLEFVEKYIPSLFEEKGLDWEKVITNGRRESGRVDKLKKGILYHLIVATVVCMVNSEKEKRHTLIDLILGIGENAGNGGG